jgi:hypothetical protein
MKHLKYAALLFFMLSVVDLKAQEIEVEEEASPHMFGLAAGFTSGLGLSYEYKPKRLGVQVLAFPIITENMTFLSAGLNFKYDLKVYESFSVFGFLNNRLRMTDDIYGITGNENYAFEAEGNYFRIAHGAGLGLNIEVFDHFGLNLMTGFGVYNYSGFSMTLDSGLYFRL